VSKKIKLKDQRANNKSTRGFLSKPKRASLFKPGKNSLMSKRRSVRVKKKLFGKDKSSRFAAELAKNAAGGNPKDEPSTKITS
jgi:hypothetical protein